MLTEDDNLIRAQDTPERMQLTTSSLSGSSSISTHQPLTSEDINNGGAMWVTQRLSPTKTREFFSPQGTLSQYRTPLVMAVTFALRCMFVDEYEVPYIWTHKRDHISHFDPENPRSGLELLTLSELWRIYSLGQKYRSLVERRTALSASYARLQVEDEYYQNDIVPMIGSVEVVADTTEWLLMKYKDKKQNNVSFHFHDDEEVDRKHKTPSRVSAYELANKSIVSKLADVSFRSSIVPINYLFCGSRALGLNLTKLSGISSITKVCITSMTRTLIHQSMQSNSPTPIRSEHKHLRKCCVVPG